MWYFFIEPPAYDSPSNVELESASPYARFLNTYLLQFSHIFELSIFFHKKYNRLIMWRESVSYRKIISLKICENHSRAGRFRIKFRIQRCSIWKKYILQLKHCMIGRLIVSILYNKLADFLKSNAVTILYCEIQSGSITKKDMGFKNNLCHRIFLKSNFRYVVLHWNWTLFSTYHPKMQYNFKLHFKKIHVWYATIFWNALYTQIFSWNKLFSVV